ncbi:LuxR family transcriptional regulator [Serratia sp. NPDC078593]|uniref:response regulator transcription factor n=1 Tax=unclassified Serratia (in: enterobacteria) TaxID=2647522 RepID=UPI0037CF98C0
MKLLVVDECGYTRLGITHYFADTAFNNIKCSTNLTSAVHVLAGFKPTHILLNLTNVCRHNDNDSALTAFINASQHVMLFIYLEMPYPYGDSPIRFANNAFLFNKSVLSTALRTLREAPMLSMSSSSPALFSPQELTVMNLWMAEMPNYRIARKLQISSHTVYVHKRHITEKINVRNRLEFYSLYKILRYFYPAGGPVQRVSLTQPTV